jgi:hypothetical protein
MATTTTYRINLVVDEKMDEILNYFRAKYPLLKDSDLIRLAVSVCYTNDLNNLPTHSLNDQQEESLHQSLQSKTGQEPKFSKAQDLVDYLDQQ